MITPADLQRRVKAMGKEITGVYKDKKPLFLSVLNGGFIFAADLVRACDMECEISFVKLSSYEGMQSTGSVSVAIGLDKEIKGRDIVIVEDIIDSGKTLQHFMTILKAQEPASIAIAACLLKPEALEQALFVDYVGFAIPNEFVVGYGLDYDGLGRNLKGIYSLEGI